MIRVGSSRITPPIHSAWRLTEWFDKDKKFCKSYTKARTLTRFQPPIIWGIFFLIFLNIYGVHSSSISYSSGSWWPNSAYTVEDFIMLDYTEEEFRMFGYINEVFTAFDYVEEEIITLHYIEEEFITLHYINRVHNIRLCWGRVYNVGLCWGTVHNGGLCWGTVDYTEEVFTVV